MGYGYDVPVGKATHNPHNRFEQWTRELLEPPQPARLNVLKEDRISSILSRNDSPDLSFRWSCNPYRGCVHACLYCFARPTHEYWGFGAGTDFETNIIAKPNAAELLRRQFLKPSWRGEVIVFSGNTDAYQPIEATLRLTRSCLEVCAEFRNPVAIITKSALVTRDCDLLTRLHSEAHVTVYFSIPFAKASVARKVEPQAPSPTKRFEAMSAISDAGISTGISIAPMIPGLNDEDIPTLLKRAKEAGASVATGFPLRLSGSVMPYFLEHMAKAFPARIQRITNRIRETRNGKLSESNFFDRHVRSGPYGEIMNQLFTSHCRRLGLEGREADMIPNTFRRPIPEQLLKQQRLF